VTVSGGGILTALQFLSVQVELVLGAWLIQGRWRVAAWLLASSFLAVLATLSLLSAVRGQSDCGCFGNFKVHPGIMAGLNLAGLGLLWVARPKVRWSENRSTVAVVATLAVVVGGMARIANRPLGERLPVKFLSYSADGILPALATRAGGETATLPD
jgi:hypothetical protein